MSVEDAVDTSIAEMPDAFLLKPQLIHHKAEVKGMILTEYDEEEVLKSIKEEGRIEGEKKGREEGEKKGRIEGEKKGRIEGVLDTLKALVADNLLSVSEAAQRANLSEAAFLEKCAQTTE